MSKLNNTSRGISPQGKSTLSVADLPNNLVLKEILQQLKIMNRHLYNITDEEISCKAGELDD